MFDNYQFVEIISHSQKLVLSLQIVSDFSPPFDKLIAPMINKEKGSEPPLTP
jgi:hypothetical protein